MGCQSQTRNGAIRRCKKRATKVKRSHKRQRKTHTHVVQGAIGGGRAFDPVKDCIVCKAYCLRVQYQRAGWGLIRIPKRSHHIRCPKNTSTWGLSARTVEVEKAVQAHLKINNAPIENLGRPGTTAQEKLSVFNKAKKVTEPEPTTLTDEDDPTEEDESPVDMPTVLRNAVDNYVADCDEMLDDGMGAPDAIRAVMDYILELTDHTKKKGAAGLPPTQKNAEAMNNYRRFFLPGEIMFRIPKERRVHGRSPSPHYHAIEDTSVLLVDWLISHPEQRLVCLLCENVTLVHDRTNYKKNRSLFPIFEKSGATMWASVMRYVCPNCNEGYSGNSGTILQMLDSDARQAYPVEPRYALGAWHFSMPISDTVDSLMKTYGNGNMISKVLYQQQGRFYLRKLQSYLSLRPTKNYLLFYATIGSYAPSGADIRFLYQQAERSEDTLTQVSNVDRYRRELQSVTTSKASAIDWTFEVVKNYKLPGAKALFTMNTESKEIANLAIVRDTKAEQIAHAVEQQVRRRENFRPILLYTDTWPHNEYFWKMLLGEYLEGRLGLFHLIKRVTETMNLRSALYWKALYEFKMCVYSYNGTDEAAVVRALVVGKLSSDGAKYSSGKIRTLRFSPRWKHKCEPYLRKEFNEDSLTKSNWENWLADWEDQVDDDGRPIFPDRRATAAALKEQSKKVQYVRDHPDFVPYREVPAGPRSKHGLSKWKSLRNESHLEGFHKKVAHFGNTGMAKGLSDCLVYRGAAEHNVAVRHDLSQAEGWLLQHTPPAPEHVRQHPPFVDHLLLELLNEQAREAKLDAPFKHVRATPEDNGEVFLSEYFEEQEKRNSKNLTDPNTRRCLCAECWKNPLPYINESIGSSDTTATTLPPRPTTTLLPAPAPAPPAVVQVPVQRPISIPPQMIPMIPQWGFPRPIMFQPPNMMIGHFMQHRPVQLSPCNCQRFNDYLRRRAAGSRMGRPPNHENGCPFRK
jgi:hypothetical protein